MEFQKLINTRRSIRSFDADKKVTEAQVKKIVEAAIQAPSWKNSQTARYHCILSDDMIQKFSAECLPTFNQKSSGGAALVVTTFVKQISGHTDSVPDNELGDGWGCYDLGLHNENFVLKAKEMGLGTLIMGIRDAAKIREMLQIPEEETIVAVIAVGYPAADTPKRPRKTVEEIAKFY